MTLFMFTCSSSIIIIIIIIIIISLQVFTANGKRTIEPLDPLYKQTIGQRVQLSFLDTKLLNLAYCSGQFRFSFFYRI